VLVFRGLATGVCVTGIIGCCIVGVVASGRLTKGRIARFLGRIGVVILTWLLALVPAVLIGAGRHWWVLLRAADGQGTLALLNPGQKNGALLLCRETGAGALWVKYSVLVAGDGRTMPLIRATRTAGRKPASPGPLLEREVEQVGDSDFLLVHGGNGWLLVVPAIKQHWAMMGTHPERGTTWSAMEDLRNSRRTLSLFDTIGPADTCDDDDAAALEDDVRQAVARHDRDFFTLGVADEDLRTALKRGNASIESVARRLCRAAGPAWLPKTCQALGEGR